METVQEIMSILFVIFLFSSISYINTICNSEMSCPEFSQVSIKLFGQSLWAVI